MFTGAEGDTDPAMSRAGPDLGDLQWMALAGSGTCHLGLSLLYAEWASRDELITVSRAQTKQQAETNRRVEGVIRCVPIGTFNGAVVHPGTLSNHFPFGRANRARLSSQKKQRAQLAKSGRLGGFAGS